MRSLRRKRMEIGMRRRDKREEGKEKRKETKKKGGIC